MTTLIAFVVVLGFLVFVHEFGHFLIAKWVGVKVYVFSIGFGSRLFGFKRGDTDYRVSAIPLGGYVKMAGENPTEPLKGSPDEFASRSIKERLAIIVAGPFMNLIWAVLFIIMVFYFGIEQPTFLKQQARIGWIQPNSIAEQAGLQAGDIIVSLGQQTITRWEQALKFIDTTSVKDLTITVRRQDREIQVQLKLDKKKLSQDGGTLGFFPPLPPVVGELRKGWPAEKAGIQPGDKIIALNGETIHDWYELTHVIHNSPGVPVELQVERKGEKLSFTLTPRKDEADGKGYIGMLPFQQTEKVKYGLGESVKQSLVFNWRMTRLTLGYLWKVITGQQSGKSIGGPIAIAQFAGQAARTGLTELIRLMGFLSLQLGLLNLLPIPVLDGGNVLLLAIEGVSGRPISLKKREIIQMIGLAILLAIMAYAIFNDISRFFSP